MKPRRGFALLAGVWLMVGIAAVGLEVAWLARGRALQGANGAESEQVRAGARAGLEQARGRLARALAATRGDALADPWRHLPGDSLQLDDVQAQFEIHDAASTLDRRVATPTMLARLAQACGATGDEAATIASDDSSASVALATAHSTWQSCVDRNVARGTGQVNPNTASAEVLAALPGLSMAAADAIVRARATHRLLSWNDVREAVPVGMRESLDAGASELQSLFTYSVDAVRVTSEARRDGSPAHGQGIALIRRVAATAWVEWQVVQ